MIINTYSSTLSDTQAAVAELRSQVQASGQVPHYAMLLANASHAVAEMQAVAWGDFGRAMHGATSCLGAMTGAGAPVRSEASLSLFTISDPDGDYGTGFAALGKDPRAQSCAATRQALTSSDRPGEIPDVVWVTATPGAEEAVIAGIQDAVGPDVPIIGGSAADNDVTGQWYVFDTENAGQDAVVVSVMFPSVSVSYAYQNGYAPSDSSGTVTRVEGRRLIEIDHRPAQDVYAEWTHGAIAANEGAQDTNILSDATLWPLGRETSEVQGVSQFLLAHPAMAHPDGSISLFANLEPGERITQMSGTASALADRAGRVAKQARPRRNNEIVGALMVYCGGCMLSIQDRLDTVVTGTRTALDEAPFLGHFSFGEQGSMIGSGNRHGNLMISCLVFSKEK